MINQIIINNFRGIDSVKVNSARRINVLVGPNGTGKTAFLEAIFLASGSTPEILQRTKAWRGRDNLSNVSQDQIATVIWADTFRDPGKGFAKIELIGESDDTRAISISRSSEFTKTLISNKTELTSVDLTFSYESPTYGTQTPEIEFNSSGLTIKAVPSNMNAHFISSRVNVSEVETARFYSQLRVEGRSEIFERTIKNEFPLIEDLSVEAPWGSPAIYARMKSGRTLPITMISSGINQLVAIIIRLCFKKRSILLIDEIENGFFHDRFAAIWRILHDISVEMDSQIFATTHSLECLQALRTSLSQEDKDIRFLRSRHKNNEVMIDELSGKALFGALNLGEVR